MKVLSSDLAVYLTQLSIRLKNLKTPSNKRVYTLLLRQREKDVLMPKKSCTNLLLVNLWNFAFLNYRSTLIRITKMILQLMVLMKVMITHLQPALWMKVIS